MLERSLHEPEVLALLTCLNRHGEARLVGGCVRDSLLGLPFTDIDIATTLMPKQVIEAVTQVDMRAIPTGIDHGTVTVLHAGKSEIHAVYRSDGSACRAAFCPRLPE